MAFEKVNQDELFEHFKSKYGKPEETGWSPRRRLDWGYYPPGDVYECLVSKMVSKSVKWIDIGGGRALFPYNKKLSQTLAEECEKLVAVDPSENVYENPYAHEKHKSMIEDFQTNDTFDIATFRMVAEHVDNPQVVLSKLKSLLKPSGYVVIYTINKYSPIPIITYLTPFALHFRIKKFFWGGEEKDTFPVAYKMNTRKDLNELFSDQGFKEVSFQYLSDLSTFSRFKSLNLVELFIWKILNKLSITYPENNLLGVYQHNAQDS